MATEPITCDTRIIAATHKDLVAMVAKNLFREDLYYRLNVIPTHLPPLRDRREDIPLLIGHFIEKMNLIRGKAISGFDDESLHILMCHDYPGNIRELENILERALTLCEGDTIEDTDLQLSPDAPEPARAVATETPADLPDGASLEDYMDEVEKKAILNALTGRTVTAHALTHAHFDHIGGLETWFYRLMTGPGRGPPRVPAPPVAAHGALSLRL